MAGSTAGGPPGDGLAPCKPAGADLKGADLGGAILAAADLAGADFNRTLLGDTLFIDIDLRCAIGLESASHRGPSHIGIDTLVRSNGEIPEIFLQAAGVPEPLLSQIKSMVRRDAIRPSAVWPTP